MRNYINLFGVSPWDIYDSEPPVLHDRVYHGRPANFTMRVACVKGKAVELELVQPLSGDNIYSDFIAKHGEGIHHLQFLVDDIDETTNIMAKEGFPALMAAKFLGGGFAYYDTIEPLKVIWKAFQLPTNMPPMKRYP